MLTNHTISKHRSFQDLTFELSGITVFTGNNNTGKTSLLKHIYYNSPEGHVLMLSSNRRTVPSYFYLKTNSLPFSTGVNGQFVYPFFIALDKHRPFFQSTLSTKLSDLNLLRTIHLKQSTTKPNKYKIIAKSLNNAKVEVNKLGDSVTSFLQLFLLLEYVDRGTTIILENPENSLDPTNQCYLADTLIDYYQQKDIQFIVETQSNYFIRRIQHRVAQRSLRLSDFKAYAVYSDDKKSNLFELIFKNDGFISNIESDELQHTFSIDWEEFKPI